MAQTGYTPILIYSSSTTTNAPAAGNLTNSTLGSELAINITDGKLFYKDNANAIQVIGWKVVPATAGGTGQTSYTQGDLLYATSSTTLGRLADVVTGNALISGGVGGDPAWGKIGLTTHVSGVLPTANGGTNLSSFTANGVFYASSTSALATASSFTYNGTTLSLNSATAAMGIGATGDNTYHFFRTIDNAGESIYIGNDNAAGSFFGAGAYGRVLYSEGAKPLKVFVNGAYRAEYDTSGNYKLDTGNLIQGTAAKGFNFTANTPAAGMTSRLLNWYEEGTWTPVPVPTSGAITTYTSSGIYTRVGRQVTLTFTITISNAGTAVALSSITGIPFTNGGEVASGCGREAGVTGSMWQYTISASATSIAGRAYNNDPSIISGYILYGSITYTV